MGRGHGGTRSVAANSGGRVVFQGGWSGSANDTSTIQISAVNKQTEKAINISTVVNWGEGGGRPKDLWIPKSQVGSIKARPASDFKEMKMSKWFANKISYDNRYKGYQMQFTFSDNV